MAVVNIAYVCWRCDANMTADKNSLQKKKKKKELLENLQNPCDGGAVWGNCRNVFSGNKILTCY